MLLLLKGLEVYHEYTLNGFNKLFDNTILKPYAIEEDFKKVCEQSVKYGFCTVAVNTGVIKLCADLLAGTGVKVDAAVGFPLGITTINAKLHEALGAIKDGAGEVDYVLNIGKRKEGNFDYIKEEMKAMTELCREHGVISKVIFENCYLTEYEKQKACEISLEVLPDFIKTSTGFGPSSATVEDVRLMRQMVGDKIKVKAAGGIRDYATCMAILEAGAERIGCSNSMYISDEFLKYNKE